MAIPPGPIAMVVINMSLGNNLRQSIQLITATSLMDLMFCLIAIFATSAIQLAIGHFISQNPMIVLIFQIAVVLGLIAFGIITVLNKPIWKNSRAHKKGFIQENSMLITRLTKKGPFFVGIALAITNLANPPFIGSLAVVSTQARKFGAIENLFIDDIFFSIGFGIGNFLWLYLVTKTISHFSNKVPAQLTIRIKQIAGIVFIFAGLIIAYNVFL